MRTKRLKVIAPVTADRPIVDEWGIYDPTQAGFEALVERLAVKGVHESTAQQLVAEMEHVAQELRTTVADGQHSTADPHDQ